MTPRALLGFRSGIFTLVSTLALTGVLTCASPASTPGPGMAGTSGAAGTTGGAGTTGAAGTTGGAGTTGAAGTTGVAGTTGGAGTGAGGTSGTGGGGVTCTNTDHSIVPIDSTGWVDKACNDYAIQGAWYCYADSGSDCVSGSTPYKSSSMGMCISGMTTTSTSGYAGVGLSLNDSGGASPVKSAYNATSHSIVGFAITIAGSTGGLTLRINYTTAASSSNPAPFFEVAGPGTYMVMFPQASVPASWAVPNAGQKADATAVYDVQVQVAGGTAASYNFCVTSLKPIMASTGGGCASGACGTLTGSNQICGAQNTANVGNYAVQNNIFSNGTGQCVTPTVNASGSCAGFSTSFTGTFGNTGNSPSSYPSVIYGWQAGTLYGCYQPKQVSAIASIPSTWSFTTPTSGKWDAAYDIWFGASATTANNAQTTELMIWQNYGGNAQPVGSMIASTTIAGASYEVWTGTVSGWKYIAYRRSPGSSSAVDFDLKPFVTDAVSRGQVSSSAYLLGIQAGFEIWQSGGTAPSVQSFNVSVN